MYRKSSVCAANFQLHDFINIFLSQANQNRTQNVCEISSYFEQCKTHDKFAAAARFFCKELLQKNFINEDSTRNWSLSKTEDCKM
jgi:intergrase/recombinase